jgi:dTDP-glucose 4,6-dehydratase
MKLLDDDLDHILNSTNSLWEELRGKRLFITGGTGFFGRWFLESFAWANTKLDLGASVLALTRNPVDFKKKAPHLADNPSIKFLTGDVRDFKFPDGEFSHIIHAAATSATETFNNEDPLNKFDTVVEGTKHVLDFAVHCGAENFLFTSSGVVYGKQSPEIPHLFEDYHGAPNPIDVNSAWGESKRAAEFLCAYYSNKYGIKTKIARCFSFVGPYLPLDIHYAVGNFIRDALNGGPINIIGDGTPIRSYLYASDLMIFLWTILFKGVAGRAYNVGSEKAVSIKELAQLVANCFPNSIKVIIAKEPSLNSRPERYIPSLKRIKDELGLKESVDLKEAIRRTINFYKIIK